MKDDRLAVGKRADQNHAFALLVVAHDAHHGIGSREKSIDRLLQIAVGLGEPHDLGFDAVIKHAGDVMRHGITVQPAVEVIGGVLQQHLAWGAIGRVEELQETGFAFPTRTQGDDLARFFATADYLDLVEILRAFLPMLVHETMQRQHPRRRGHAKFQLPFLVPQIIEIEPLRRLQDGVPGHNVGIILIPGFIDMALVQQAAATACIHEATAAELRVGRNNLPVSPGIAGLWGESEQRMGAIIRRDRDERGSDVLQQGERFIERSDNARAESERT